MPWLLRADEVLAALDPPSGGLLVTAPVGPAAVVQRTAVVHTLGRCPGVDIAWCGPLGARSGSWVVRRTASVSPRRVVVARAGRGAVVLATPGSFDRWSLRTGDELRIEGQ
jgi:hypothetical protein